VYHGMKGMRGAKRIPLVTMSVALPRRMIDRRWRRLNALMTPDRFAEVNELRAHPPPDRMSRQAGPIRLVPVANVPFPNDPAEFINVLDRASPDRLCRSSTCG